MNMSIRQDIINFRKNIEATQKALRQSKMAEKKEDKPKAHASLDQLTFAPDTEFFFKGLFDGLMSEVHRYGTNVALEKEETTPKPLKEQLPLTETMTVREHETGILTYGPDMTRAQILSPYVRSACREFFPHFQQNLLPQPEEANTQLTAAELYAYTLIQAELGAMQEGSLLSTFGASSVNKVKKAMQAFLNRRHGDALTVLRNALKADTHNLALLYTASQFQYLQAAQGHNNTLPDARSDAKNSLAYTDKVPAEKLLEFRFHAIMTERGFSTSRPLEWMRDANMLVVENLTRGDGLSNHNSAHLKSWILLSTIPVEQWGDFEFESMIEFTEKTVGGAAFYLYFFRKAILKELAKKKQARPEIEHLEKRLQGAYQNYLTIAAPLRHWNATEGQLFWMVKNRYLNTIADTAPLPTFDQVLLNISLDGRSFKTENFPDTKLVDHFGRGTVQYWRTWALSLTPDDHNRTSHLLPADDIKWEADFIPDMETLLQKLRDCENERLTEYAEVWNDIKPFMVRWNMDHLLAAGTGSNQPRNKSSLTIAPFSTFYRQWNDPLPANVLCSKVIEENARRGAFSSIFEVTSAFEGAYRLLDDPNHGIKVQAKRALNAANRKDPNKFRGIALDTSNLEGSKIITSLLLPIALIAFLLVALMMSKSSGQTLGLIVALGGAGVFMTFSLTKKK